MTTGFGEFKDKPIAPDDLEQLQRNLLLSHSVGVGENSDPDDLTNYYPAEVVRGALATRLNAFLKGHSGVRSKLVEIVQAMLNRGVIPLVPLRGSVGASGDLCPLSHLFVTLLGEGRFYTIDDATLRSARELPEILGFTAEEMKPTFKEGLGLVNGANFSAAMLALAVYDAGRLADDRRLRGGAVARSDGRLHARARCEGSRGARAHGPDRMRAPDPRDASPARRLVERAGAVQDAYSLRCAPQVHGATRDTLRFVRTTAERELNAATDNPLFFEEGDPFDLQFRANWPEWYGGETRLAYSAGNFHGQPLALAADFLTIAIAELGNISERRTQLMLDGHHNRGLPPNLTTRPGVNSGLMILQYTAASIVSENKVLSHPASVDSIPTGANAEDHVSMSTTPRANCGQCCRTSSSVIAIELLSPPRPSNGARSSNTTPTSPRPGSSKCSTPRPRPGSSRKP